MPAVSFVDVIVRMGVRVCADLAESLSKPAGKPGNLLQE